MRKIHEIKLRTSTIFLGLGAFCFVLLETQSLPGQDQFLGLLYGIFGRDLTVVLFGELAPIWCLVGALAALVYLVMHGKTLIPGSSALVRIRLVYIFLHFFSNLLMCPTLHSTPPPTALPSG